MDRSSPGTSDNSRINEATPLLRDDSLEIPPEVYALGGAVGGSDPEIYDAEDGSRPEMYGAVGDSGPEMYGTVGGSKTEMYGALCGPIAEMEDIIGALIASMGGRFATRDGEIGDLKNAIDGQCVRIPMWFGNTKTDVRERMKDASGSAKKIDGSTAGKGDASGSGNEADDLTAEMNDASESDHKINDSTARMDASRGTKEDNSKAGLDVSGNANKADDLAAEIDDATRSANKADDSAAGINASGSATDALSDSQADIDNILETLFVAWQHSLYDPLKSPEDRPKEFFSARTLHDMSAVWRQIRKGRDVLPEPEVIVQGLTKSFVDYFYPRNLKVPEGQEEVIKEIFTACITEKIAGGWKQILDLIDKEDRERAQRRREARRRIRERVRKSQAVAEVLRFYAPFAQLQTERPVNCRTFGLAFCNLFAIFVFQIPFHFLLLSWPISIGVMGGLYRTECPMSHLMPYVMMVLGSVGTVALLMRLALEIYAKLTEDYGFRPNLTTHWRIVKFIEFLFVDFLIVHLIYFFSATPSFDSGSPMYCNKTFYTYVYYINYVSIGLVSFWMFVYFTVALLLYLSRDFNLGYR